MSDENIVQVNEVVEVIQDNEFINVVQPAEPNIVQVVNTGNVIIAPLQTLGIIAVGLQGPPGTSSGVLVSEVPSGLIDNSNRVFHLSHSAQVCILYLNGLALSQGNDYNLSNTVLTFVVEATPQTDDTLLCLFSY